MTTFEDRLLDQLQLVVAANPDPAPARPRTRRRVALAGALATTGAVTFATLVTGGGDPAYAIQQRADGAVTVSIASLSDAAGLQRKLRAAGIPADVRYLENAPKCVPLSSPGSGPRIVHHKEGGPDDGPELTGPGPGRGSVHAAISANIVKGGEATFTIDPDAIRPGDRLHITASQGELSTLAMGIGETAPPAPPC